MAANAFDLVSYQHLLQEFHPTLPHTEEENERLLRAVLQLQDKASLTPEEKELLEMLLVLIEKFEDEHYNTSKAKPHEILRELMRARDMSPRDVYHIFGSKGTTSEVLRGKRGVSKAAAKALAQMFHVKTELFL